MYFSKFTFIIGVFLILPITNIYSFPKSDLQKTHGDRLIIGHFLEPSIINPILTHTTISAALKGMVFDGLIKLNEKMEPVPHLALSWKNSPDGLTWIFHLRRDVKFHDGTELTAEDVKFTFDKINDPSINSPFISIFKNFKTVKVKDRYNVEINLKNTLPSLPFYLDVGILPKHLLEDEEIRRCQFNYHPIGTGPFKLQLWSENEIALKANKDYFGDKSHLSTVIVKIFKDQNTIWAELMKGNVDCVVIAYLKNYDIIEKIPEFKVYSLLDPYCYILAFNGDNPFFNQKSVRQALNYAVDKEGVISKVLRGKGRISSGTIYPQSWGYDKSIEPFPYNPKRASKLLEKAGWRDTNGNYLLDKDGKDFEFLLLMAEGDDVARGCALQIQQQLLDVGIRMKVKALSFSNMHERFLSTKKFDASLLTILSDTPDRNYAWWHSSQINHGFNVFSYKNEKVDELLDKGRVTLDREQRKQIYHQFQKEMYENPPGIFLFWRDYLIGIHKRFKGVKVSPAGIFNNINEWYVPKEEQKYR